MTSGDLTIVIVTHNSARAIGRCLDALGGNHVGAVLAIDNGSTDTTLDVLRARDVTVLANRANHGFGRAANRAAREAAGRTLLFLNPDCEVDPRLLEAGLARLDRDGHACVAPEFDEGDGQIVAGCQPGYTPLKLIDDMLRSNYANPRMCERLRARPGYHDPRWQWPHGACFFVRRSAFLAAGGFDERYFLYMEDVDFGRRFCASGGAIVSLPLRVRHRCRTGADVDARRRLGLLNASRIRYARLRHGRVLAGVLASLALPARAARAMRAGDGS